MDDNEKLVRKYFELVPTDYQAAAELFSDDAVLFEPFSKENGLKGKDDIRQFLKVASMANSGLERDLIVRQQDGHIEALVHFTKGSTVRGRFVFKFQELATMNGMEKKIKELRIRFFG
jgi:ketosteroid isomerase-like protein